MPHVARTGLAALVLVLAVGIAGAPAEQAGAVWTDPPARKAGAEKVPAEAPKAAETPKAAPSQAAAPSTPAAASAEPARRAARKTASRRERVRPVAVAHRQAPTRRRIAAAPSRIHRGPPRVRTAQVRPPRVVAAAPVARAEPGTVVYETVRPLGYGPGYGPGYADERLERLRAAEEAGYLVVRRRSVEFPDGRSLRIYRPTEDGEPF